MDLGDDCLGAESGAASKPCAYMSGQTGGLQSNEKTCKNKNQGTKGKAGATNHQSRRSAELAGPC